MDFTTVTLGAAAKAMQDTVIPAAIASGQAQAAEQAHLVRDAILFARDRVHLVAARRRYEVVSTTEVIETLATDPDVAGLAVGEDLAEIVSASKSLTKDPSASAASYSDMAFRLGRTLDELCEAADTLAPDARSRIETAVLAHGMNRIELDRSWLMPLGFDPQPSTVVPVESLLE